MLRVLVVDGSLLMREMLSCLLESDASIEVCGTAGDLATAQRLLRRLSPDVVVMDVEVPGSRGRAGWEAFLHAVAPPVILLTRLTQRSLQASLRVVELGAFDVVIKTATSAREMSLLRDQLHTRVHAAQRSAEQIRVLRKRKREETTPPPPTGAPPHLIAFGATSGGAGAVSYLLRHLPDRLPPVLMAQPLPEPFPQLISRHCAPFQTITVLPARPGLQLLPGHVYITCSSHPVHLRVEQTGLTILPGRRTSEPEPLNNLFSHLAETVGARAMGVLLAGCGTDGSNGLGALQQCGATTWVQSPLTATAPELPLRTQMQSGKHHSVALENMPQFLAASCPQPCEVPA
jgi:two-component system chemotaxis response regulator CheB